MDPRGLGCKCSDCPLRDGKPTWVEPPKNPAHRPSLFIIGEGPGPTEEAFGAYFVGRSGDMLDSVLMHVGKVRADASIGNATLCRPLRKLDNAERRKAVECCRPQLDLRLGMYPEVKHVLALGKWAMFSLVGKENIFAWAGAPLESRSGHTVISTLHPAFTLRKSGWAYRPVVFVHADRLIRLASGELPEWTWPEFHLEPDERAVQILEQLLDEKLPVGFDVETKGVDPLTSPVMSMGLSNEKVGLSVPWQPYYSRKTFVKPIGAYPLGRKIVGMYKQVLEHPDIEKWCQNGIHDIVTASRLGIKVAPYTFDTMLAHTVVAQGRKHDLGWISCEEYHAPRWKEEKHTASNEKGADKFANRHPLELRLYNAKDCYMTVLDALALRRRLDKEHSGEAVFQSYMTNAKIAIRMYHRGVQFDRQALAKHRPLILSNKARAKRELKAIAAALKFSGDFNPASGRDVNRLLRECLQVTPTKYSQKTGEASWDEEAINNLLSHSNTAVVMVARSMLRYRRWVALKKYTEIPLDDKGVCHVTWKPGGAKTMRWSSSPNMQNLPPRMRNIVRSHSKDGWIVRADYDQLELRIATMLAGAKKLIEVFQQGKDPHKLNAVAMFGGTQEGVTKDMRDMAKMSAYQMMYGGTPEALWKKIIIDFPDMTLARCQSIRNRWFSTHYEFGDWHTRLLREAQENRYIEAPLSGHRFYFFGDVEESFVFNYPVQHTAADIINPTVKPICDGLNWKTESFIAQIHDELALEGKKPVKLADLLVKHMTQEVMGMPFTVGIKVGRNYRDCLEVKPGQSVEAAVELLNTLEFEEAQEKWKEKK